MMTAIDLAELIARLASNASAIDTLVKDLSPEQLTWRPAPDAWSVLMLLCHLIDEEREDFRIRLDYMMHRPGEKLPPTDPEGWARSRGYNERDPRSVLAEYLAERRRSTEWLAALHEPDWDRTYQFSSRSVAAGDILLAWLAHDYLHMRQLVKLLYDYSAQRWQPYENGYAGTW